MSAERLAHLAGRGRLAGAEARMGEQCDLGRDAETFDCGGRERRHLGNLLGCRIDVHMRVAQEHHAALQDQRRKSA